MASPTDARACPIIRDPILHLQQLRDEFTDCVGCGCLSIDRCLVANRDDILGAKGPGPRRLIDG